MKRTGKAGVFLAVALLIATCADPYEENITPAYEQYPVATLLSRDSSFTLWVAMLRHTGLYNTMNLSATYTCFVPDNGAMERYLQGKGAARVGDLAVAEARYLVKYHTIAGSLWSQSLFDNGVIPDTTATGDFLSIAIREGGLNAIYVNNEARIKQLDVEATNGIIHVLEEVLTPVTQTIRGKMEQPGFSLMREALEKTGYADLLNATTVAETNPLTGETVVRKKYYTLFAVSDETFAARGIHSLSDLLAFLGAGGSDLTSPANELNRFIAYHILPQQLDFAQLADFPEEVHSKNIATLAENQLINFSEEGDKLRINFRSDSGTWISIVDNNISTKNGVIHTLSDLMVVVPPPVTAVTWEFTDYPDVASVVPNLYRKSNISSTTTRFFDPGEVTSWSWAAIPSSKNNNAVAYLVANKNDATRYEMLNYDGIVLELGLYGWVEMHSPAIIAGKYNMKIRYYSLAASSKSGKFMVILDGAYVGSEIATHGASTSKTQVLTTTVGVVTFGVTASHKLRILAGDNATLYLDAVIFEPIE